MKLLFSLALLLISGFISAQTLDSLELKGSTLLYHRIESSSEQKKGLVVYMHGGVSQFQGLSRAMRLPTEALLEGNPHFLPTMDENGYDVVLPIAFNEYNWLTEAGALFVKALMNEHSPANGQVYIVGFSDGGTGAYRMFYNNSEDFAGLMVFNGYPQLSNFQETVDYTSVTDKTVIFASTSKDKQILPEFLMVEFRRQQILNEKTFLLVRDGKHSFAAYEKKDFEKCIGLLEMESQSLKKSGFVCVYPPMDAFIVQEEVLAFYPFRKGKAKSYGMLPQEYERTDYDYKEFSKVLKKGGNILVHPVFLKESQLKSLDEITFTIEVNGVSREITLTNWLNSKAWN